MLFLIALYALFFLILTLINFRSAIFIFAILLPSYLIRFNIGPLPSTLLELMFGIIFAVWLLKYFRADRAVIKEIIQKNRFLFICLGLFLLSSFGGIFVSDMWWASAGWWRAFYLEPILFFIVLLGRREQIKNTDLIWTLVISALGVGALALIQKISGQFIPPGLWDDELNGRAVSFFTSPNILGFYLVPVVVLSSALFKKEDTPHTPQKILLGAILAVILAAVFFSFSQGAWIALFGAILVLFYLLGFKKTAILAAIAGVIFAVAIPTFLLAITFKDTAGQNRLLLWNYTREYLTASPKNFLLGAGVRQFFRKIQKPHYDPKILERLTHPHNIFLNFWTESGLLGMISFAGVFYLLARGAYIIYKKNYRLLGAALLAALAAILIHGLVDTPYYKNDLAMMFWIFAALILK